MGTFAADPELTGFFRAEVLAEITRKAKRKGEGDLAARCRKIFRALSGMGVMQAVFGDEYESTRKRLDNESKAARR